MFLLETVEGTEFEPGTGTIALSSHIMSGYTQALGLVGNRVSAGRLQIGDWSQSTSELTLSFRGSVDIRRNVARGQLLVLRVGWPGWAAGDYEPVYYGSLSNIDRSGDDWSLTMRSIVNHLVTRMTQDSDEAVLFNQLAETELDGGYTPGDGTVTVVSTAAAEIEGGAGGEYLIQIHPSTGDDPFFLTATGKTGTTFTGCSAAGVLGTTAVATSPPDVVKFCAHIGDSPIRAALKVMMSTGGGLNGEFDDLPFTWGVGIPYFAVDFDDSDVTNDAVTPAGVGSPQWNVYSTEPQEDGLSWLHGVLGPAGIFPCERQGLLTLRSVSPAEVRHYTMTAVSDADLISIDRHETWDTSSPIEHSVVFVQSPSGTSATVEDLDSRPAGTAVVELNHITDDQSAWRTSVLARTSPWMLRVPEIVEFTCAGLRLSMLAPCDLVELNTRHFQTRDRAEHPTLMVLSVETDWWQGTVRIVAAYHPPTSSEF